MSCAARNDTRIGRNLNIRENRGAERNTLLLDANCWTTVTKSLSGALSKDVRMVTRIEKGVHFYPL